MYEVVIQSFDPVARFLVSTSDVGKHVVPISGCPCLRPV
jgi:hypothetical protein